MSTTIIKSLDALHPQVKEFALMLLAECKKRGLHIGISETYRTTQRQDYLYAQGRTRPGPIITYARGASKSSYHQWRLAFDVFNNVVGDAYNISILNEVGLIGEKLGLEWGGRWASFKDRAHFQYTFGLSIKALNDGNLPPNYSSIDASYQNSVRLLFIKNIIDSPDFWLNLHTAHTSHTQSLILKIAKHFAPTTSSYEAAVKELVRQSIIGTPSVWLDPSLFTVNNIKSLFYKTAQKLS